MLCPELLQETVNESELSLDWTTQDTLAAVGERDMTSIFSAPLGIPTIVLYANKGNSENLTGFYTLM